MRRCLAMLLLLAATSASASTSHKVRIAVLGLFHPSQFVVEALPSCWLSVNSSGQQMVLNGDARERVTVSLSGGRVVLETARRKLVGERLIFSTREGDESEFLLAVPGKLQRRYRGRLIISAGKGELLAVIEMGLETAVASVVAAELAVDTPIEALKAQAVVSRSYLLKGGHRHLNADFCDTTHCQFLREPPGANSPAMIATRTTDGQVLTWKGQPFAAMYSASCGGHTHSLAQMQLATVDYPYFAVECEYCRRSPEKWSSKLSRNDADALVENNEQQRIRTARKLGWNALPSNSFTRTESVADGSVLFGVGRGHGIGLCQRGAAEMARQGKDYRAILDRYFPNTTVESVAGR